MNDRKSSRLPFALPRLALVCGALLGCLRGADTPGFEDLLKIDVHSHVFEDVPALNELLRRINVRTINVCNNGTDAHLAVPIDAWRPLDPDSNHYSYYSTNPQWHLYGKSEYPSHAAIIAARDHIMRKHPTLVVLGAHLGSLEHDLEGVAERLERYPNFHVEVAARTRNLTRHPSEKVRALFLKYPDRILYGVDMSWKPYTRSTPPTPAQREGHVRTLELRYRADYDYYAGRGTVTYSNRPVEALNLPREVLEKFYHGNARRLFKLDAAWAGPR